MGPMTSLAPSRLPADRQGRPIDPDGAQELLAATDAAGCLAWGLKTFEAGFALTTSFGIQSAVLLHMVSRLDQTIPVIWVDTGYLPPETYQYADRLCTALNLNLQVAQAALSPARMEALYGRLWETGRAEDMNTYHRLRKVEPLDRTLETLSIRCWASGVRGSQTDHRGSLSYLDAVRGRWSLHPLLGWSARDVYYYMEQQALPQHPLFEQGYASVGDWHSSRPDDGSGRATRFGGLNQECGIHLPGVMGEGI